MKLIVSYQNQLLPPPFAYAAVMKLNVEKDQTNLVFDLEYVGREDVSVDELKAEGFSQNDNFKTTCVISKNWNPEILQIEKYDFKNDPSDDIYLHVEVNGNKLGFPKNIKAAEMLFQELMQAALESSSFEAPLELNIKIHNQTHNLKWIFADRMINIDNRESIEWSLGRTFLETIYSIDFEATKPIKKSFNNAVQLEDGWWYPLKNEQVLREISSLLKKL